jgi:hypothetical protein
MGKAENRFNEAKELYRAAQVELAKWKESQADEILFLKSELEEALLDLKQAVIDLRADDAEGYSKEVNMLLADLRARREE